MYIRKFIRSIFLTKRQIDRLGCRELVEILFGMLQFWLVVFFVLALVSVLLSFAG